MYIHVYSLFIEKLYIYNLNLKLIFFDIIIIIIIYYINVIISIKIEKESCPFDTKRLKCSKSL